MEKPKLGVNLFLKQENEMVNRVPGTLGALPKGVTPVQRITRMEAIRDGKLALTKEEYELFQKLTPSEQARVSELVIRKQRAELAAESQVALLQHPAARYSRNERKRRRQQR